MSPGREYLGNELELFREAVVWKSYIGRVLSPYVEGDVLEVGAGLGGTTRSICDGRVHSWSALEPDPSLLSQLEQRLRERPLPVTTTLFLGTLRDLPRSLRFDTILYVDVLEHIEEDRRELRDSAARIRDRGRLIVLAPAHQCLYSEFDKAIGHYRRYNVRSLDKIAPPGFETEKSLYLDSAGLLASAANRLFLRRPIPRPSDIRIWDRCLVRASKVLDVMVAHRIGKTVLRIWRRNNC